MSTCVREVTALRPAMRNKLIAHWPQVGDTAGDMGLKIALLVPMSGGHTAP